MLDDNPCQAREPDKTEPVLSRRSLINALGFASVGGITGIAGCGGEGGDGSGSGGDQPTPQSADPGERIPTLILAYWNNFTPARANEKMMPSLVSDLEKLGLEVDAQGIGALVIIDNTAKDARKYHLTSGFSQPVPTRLDPSRLMQPYSIVNAGANGQSSMGQYASCEYSLAYLEQTTIADRMERQKVVTEALKIMADDVANWPLLETLNVGAWNHNELNVEGLGKAGTWGYNHNFYLQTEAMNDQNVILGRADAEIINSAIGNLITTGATPLELWNHLVYSPVTEYNEDFEIVNSLAKRVELSDDGVAVTIELKDATFHDGQSITSEDVKFTYDLLRKNYTVYDEAFDYPIESIEVVDDKTTMIHQTGETRTIVESVLPKWGIVPKNIYEEAGALDSPADFDPREPIDDENIVLAASGPFKLISMSDALRLEPYDGHPTHSPSANVILQPYQTVLSAVRALKAREINYLYGIPTEQVEDIEGDDRFTVRSSTGFTTYRITPQQSFPPMQFREMREAGHRVINRDRINEVTTGSRTNPWPVSSPFSGKHPYFPGEDLDEVKQEGFLVADTGGDIEQARSILEEAGYTWDDNDRLRYPENDIDLTPRWPPGSTPMEYPDKYPCVEELKE